MRKGLPGASPARAPLGTGTPGDGHPGDGHRAPAAPRELLPHTVQSPRTGGTRGVAQGSSRPERRSNAFGGGSHLHCPPISSLQRPQGRAQCWGGAASTHFGGARSLRGGQRRWGVPAPALCHDPPLSSGAAPNPGAGEGELGQVPPPGGGCGGRPGWAIFQCCRCLRVRRERRREEEEEARAAPWVSPRPSPPAAAGLSGDEVAPVREVSLLLLG